MWEQVKIADKLADVYEPTGGRPRFGILHLHGVGLTMLCDKPAFTQAFERLNLACVCPHGQRSWWAHRVCAELDPRLRGNDRLHEKMNALGVPHEIDITTRAGGHSWDYFNHMAERVVGFVAAGLEQESRRLL